MRALQQKVLDVFWGEEEIASMLKFRGLAPGVAHAGDVIGVLVSAPGLPRNLKEVNVSEDQLDSLADNTMKDRWAPTNPVPLTEKSMVL